MYLKLTPVGTRVRDAQTMFDNQTFKYVSGLLIHAMLPPAALEACGFGETTQKFKKI